MDKTKIQTRVDALEKEIMAKEEYAKDTQDKINELRNEYAKIKEEYDLMVGELRGLTVVLTDGL